MLYELITTEDYNNLPDDSHKQFIEIEQICCRNMNLILDNNDNNEYLLNNLRMQYMMNVAATAAELEIPGIEYPHEINNMNYDFEAFSLAVSGVVTRLRLRGLRGNNIASVQLTPRTRGLIELRIRKLRESIEQGEMAPKKRDALLKKLDALSAEIASARRVSFANVMVTLVFLGAAATSGVADAPDAIAYITQLMGQDKEAEDAETLRLNAPMMALPAPEPALPPQRTTRPRATAPKFDQDDTDIPF